MSKKKVSLLLSLEPSVLAARSLPPLLIVLIYEKDPITPTPIVPSFLVSAATSSAHVKWNPG